MIYSCLSAFPYPCSCPAAAVAAHDQEERLRRLRESAAAASGASASLAEDTAEAHAMQAAKHKAAVIAPIIYAEQGVNAAVREQRLEPGDAICRETFKALTTKGAVGSFIPPAHAHYKGVSQGPGAAGAPPARIMGGSGIAGGAGAGSAPRK